MKGLITFAVMAWAAQACAYIELSKIEKDTVIELTGCQQKNSWKECDEDSIVTTLHEVEGAEDAVSVVDHGVLMWVAPGTEEIPIWHGKYKGCTAWRWTSVDDSFDDGIEYIVDSTGRILETQRW